MSDRQSGQIDLFDPKAPDGRPGWGARILALSVALAAVALGAGGTALLHARAGEEAGRSAVPPLAVATAPLEMSDGYVVRDSFTGQTEPARSTALAFERQGLVTDIAVDEGESIGKGQVLARLDTDSLSLERQRLEAEREALVADRTLAERTLSRREQLKDRGFETSQSYDEARFRLNALKGQIASVEASLRRVALDMEKSVLTAPFDGTVSARMADEGAVVSPGTPLLELEETGRPQARIGVPAGLAARLAPGDTVTLGARGQEIEGRVVAVSPDVEPGTRTVAVRIDLDPSAGLRMGEVVRLHLTREVAERGAWVDLLALSEAERGLWSLFTVARTGEGRPVARREAVEILHVEGGRAYVRGTFADGARMVTQGTHRITVGQPVSPLEN